MSYGTIQGGVSMWAAYLWAIANQIFAYLFNLGSGHFYWTATTTTSGRTAVPEIVLNGNYPVLSAKGVDIVAAIMTIVHNGLVFVAEISTLLPSNALTG